MIGGTLSGCVMKKNTQFGVVVGIGVKKLKVDRNQITDNCCMEATGIAVKGHATITRNNKFSNNKMNENGMNKLLQSFAEQQKLRENKPNTQQRNAERQQSQQFAPHLFGRLKCARCGAEGGPRKPMIPCATCRNAAYCSKRCLEEDEPHHGLACEPVTFYTDVNGNEILCSAEVLEILRATRESGGMVCAQCNAVDVTNQHFKKCGRCRVVAYCSTRCQRQHWLTGHSSDCKKQVPTDSKPRKSKAAAFSGVVSVHATTQCQWANMPRQRSLKGQSVTKMYMGPEGEITAKVDFLNMFQWANNADPLVIKIQGNSDALIQKNTQLQMYNEDRSIDGWITADMNSEEESRKAYTLICDTILRVGEPGRIGGKKCYFQAVVQRDMVVKVDCANLVNANMEW